MPIDVSRLRDLAVSDSGFVFDPTTGRIYTVNAVGLAVLNALKAGQPADALAPAVAEAFDVQEGEDVAADVEEFLGHLRQEGLVSS